MALVSPGIEITVIDESQYLPSAIGTVPFVLLATAENKVINNTCVLTLRLCSALN